VQRPGGLHFGEEVLVLNREQRLKLSHGLVSPRCAFEW
jgi:hypothetical protein